MIEKELFQKLVIELISNKKYEDLLPSKYNARDYKKFIGFYEKLESITEISSENFETIFIAFYKFKKGESRINFEPSIKKEIAENSAYCCAMPHCRRYTKEYDTLDMKKPSGFGQAAHIYSASQNNKTRQPILIDKSEIESEKNGLWLCSNCHPYADYIAAEDLYPVDVMIGYKKKIEEQVDLFLKVKNKTYANLKDEEKKELQDLIASTKIDVSFNVLNKKEAKYILARNAISKISLLLSESDCLKYLNYEEIEIPVDNIHFHYVDNNVKESIGKSLRIQNTKKLKFILSFKNKHRKYIIKSCRLTKKKNISTIEGYFFDKKHPLYKAITFIYYYDNEKERVYMQIKMNFNEILNGKYEINKIGDFSEVLDLIDMIENNQMKVEISQDAEDKYAIVNDYQNLECDFNQFKNLAIFFRIIQEISVQTNLKMFITNDDINRNKDIFKHLGVLYDAIIFDNPPRYVNLHPTYYYDFEDFYKKSITTGSKYIDISYLNFGFIIVLKNYQIWINLGNYFNRNGLLKRKNDEDVMIDVYDAPFIFLR
jgi:hypothetical protein